tara:strand:+ start:138 stop:698 length:561 start_codon:yes stop_codon:yes gene_type:complete
MKLSKTINNYLQYIHNNVHLLNTSKVFAGVMIIVLNIASRFVTIKLSKTMESYLKNSFSKSVLIFTIAWMGTRDIYIALSVAVIFSILMDSFFNEDSAYCVLPTSFTDYHAQLAEDQTEGGEDITKNIPGMPNANKKEGLTTKKNTKPTENKEVTPEDVQSALDVISKAKQQNTWNDGNNFYKKTN